MRTFVTELAAKSSPAVAAQAPVKRWLFLAVSSCCAMRMAPLAVAVAFLAKIALTPILRRCLTLPAVRSRSFDRWPAWADCGPGLLATGLSVVLGFFVSHDVSRHFGVGNRRCCFVHADRSGHRLGRRAAATQPHTGCRERAGCSRTRGPSAIDPGYRAGCDDRDRRARAHPVLQLGRRAAVRVQRSGSARKKHQAPDAVALPG